MTTYLEKYRALLSARTLLRALAEDESMPAGYRKHAVVVLRHYPNALTLRAEARTVCGEDEMQELEEYFTPNRWLDLPRDLVSEVFRLDS
jgi:hypothetical protein